MSVGAELRNAREAQGLSLGAIARQTRVPERALAAIELNDLSTLPPRPFGRGFVRAFAEEVDLDPDRIVRDYFAQFPSTTETHTAPTPQIRHLPAEAFQQSPQWSGLVTAVAILLTVVIAATVLGGRNEETNESNAVGTTGAVPPAPATDRRAPEPQPAAARPASVPLQGATAPAAPLKLTFTFTVTSPCWVTASVDGERRVFRLVQPGERETLSGAKEITIRFGDASAVEWSINGRQGAPLGASGAVRDLKITPENVQTVS